MYCDLCKGKTVIVCSRKEDGVASRKVDKDTVFRRRKCVDCGVRFNTLEKKINETR